MLEATGAFSLADAAAAITREIWQACQLTVSALVRVRKGEIHTTSSGKIQRAACAAMLAHGAFTIEKAHLADDARAWLEPVLAGCASPVG